MGYGVEIAELRGCGKGLVRDADETADIKLGASLDLLLNAMPGGQVERAVPRLVSVWEDRVKDLDRGARRVGKRMIEAADRYARDDEAAEQNFRRMGPR
ncbi:MAG: hypothetical protein GEU86_17765 [Actinophytocola sp.]|nr:hypothetical protein [Actinophytocola sp.]